MCPRADTVSRLGGDEFVVLLSQVEREEDAAFSARKILRALAVAHVIDDKPLGVNVSIGVSTYPTDGLEAENLMDKTDTLMYEAKQQGRNNYQFFRPEMPTDLPTGNYSKAIYATRWGGTSFYCTTNLS